MKLIILNYTNGEADIYNLSDEQAKNIEEFIDMKGYSLDQVEYMAVKELKINVK